MNMRSDTTIAEAKIGQKTLLVESRATIEAHLRRETGTEDMVETEIEVSDATEAMEGTEDTEIEIEVSDATAREAMDGIGTEIETIVDKC